MSLPRSRRMVMIAASGHVSVQEAECPSPQAGEILVRVAASLISAGTELGRFVGGTRGDRPEGRVRGFGYQNAGEVIAVGEGVRNLRVGQRVACMGAGAAHTDYACVPQNLAVALPEAVTDEEGAFVALAATAMQAVRRGDVRFGEDVAVLGLGTVGQLTAQVCRAAGARVLAFDPLAKRVTAAQRCDIRLACAARGDDAVAQAHAATQGRGLDCAFLCLGGDSTAALQDARRMMQTAPDTHHWGRIVLVSGVVTHSFGADLGNLDLRSAARTGPGYHDPAYEHGADYPGVFVRWPTQAHLQLFVRWTAEGMLRVRDLITARVPVEQADAACYALMDTPGEHVGVILTYNHPS